LVIGFPSLVQRWKCFELDELRAKRLDYGLDVRYLVRAGLAPKFSEDFRTPGLEEARAPFLRAMREVHVNGLAPGEAVDGKPPGRPVGSRDSVHGLEPATTDVIVAAQLRPDEPALAFLLYDPSPEPVCFTDQHGFLALAAPTWKGGAEDRPRQLDAADWLGEEH
jgi:hypothetical protein